MRTFLVELLKQLEQAIPPHVGGHHCITYNQYGSDETDWRDELGLHVWVSGEWHTLFLRDADFAKPVGTLVAEIVKQFNDPL